jgi:hypothetical protein
MGMRRVIVHIDRLALVGFRSEDQRAINLGLQAELKRVLGEQSAGLVRMGTAAHVPHLTVGSARIENASPPSRVGERVGRAIGKGIVK